MPRLADVQARIASLGQLRDVVTAMRSLSAVRVQQAHETLLGIREYARIVESALAQATRRLPLASSPSGAGEPTASLTTTLVVFGSEHGFVGAFNEHLLDRALAHLGGPRDRFLVIGSRAAVLAAERRHP